MLTPMVLLAPEIWAVYCPGVSAVSSAESALPVANGKAPTRAAVAAMVLALVLVLQPVLVATVRPALSMRVRTGAVRTPVRPKAEANVGPAARISTCFGWF